MTKTKKVTLSGLISSLIIAASYVYLTVETYLHAGISMASLVFIFGLLIFINSAKLNALKSLSEKLAENQQEMFVAQSRVNHDLACYCVPGFKDVSEQITKMAKNTDMNLEELHEEVKKAFEHLEEEKSEQS